MVKERLSNRLGAADRRLVAHRRYPPCEATVIATAPRRWVAENRPLALGPVLRVPTAGPVDLAVPMLGGPALELSYPRGMMRPRRLRGGMR